MSMIWKHTLVFKFLLSNNFGEKMKLIIAIIQPEELPQIKEELIKRKIYKFTVTNAKGQGKEIPVQEVYRGLSHEVTLLNKVRLEIALNDDFVLVLIQETRLVNGLKWISCRFSGYPRRSRCE